jgi:hypothetical protein
MKPSVLVPVLRDCIRNKRNVFLFSPPGSGKTDIVNQAAYLEDAELMTIITSLRDPTDGNGFPFKVNDPVLGEVVKFIPTSELAKMIHATKPLVIFFDELPNATLATQASFCNLTLARTQNGHSISDHVTFICAGNRREHRTGAGAVSTAFLNRFMVLNVDVDVKDWIAWGIQDKQPDDLLAFCYARPDWLSAFKADPDTQQPTPRSIAHVGRMLKEMQDQDAVPPSNVLQEMIAGYTGIEFARDFVSAREIIREIPDPTLPIEHPETAPIPEKPIAKHAILNAVAKIVDREKLHNAFVYASRFTAEFQRAFVTFLAARDPSFKESEAYVKWEAGRKS